MRENDWVNKNVDLRRLSEMVQQFFYDDGFSEVKVDEDPNGTWFELQAKKMGALRTIVSSRKAIHVIIKGEPNKFTVSIGTGEWGKNFVVAGMLAAGYDGHIVSSASCKDDSILAQEFSHGMTFGGDEEIYTPNDGIELSYYTTKYAAWRDANQDAYGPTAPKSQFMNVAHDVMVTAIITLMRFENEGGDVDDGEAVIAYFAGQDSWHRAGRSVPMDCTTNSSEFVSVCKKDSGYYIWNGYDNGGWGYGPLGTDLIDGTELLLRMADGANARPAAG